MESISLIFNKVSLCTSYDEIQKIDFRLSHRVIDTHSSYRAPVHSAMEIYNHFHNILRLLDDLQNFTFTTSEAIRNCYL